MSTDSPWVTTEAMAADVTKGTFGYHVVLTEDDPQPVSLIATWIETGQTWIYAPAVAAQRLYDDQYQETARPVDRETAEKMARTALNTDLPDETMSVDRTTAEALANEHLPSRLPSVETLQEMINEGARMGWDYGPPVRGQ